MKLILSHPTGNEFVRAAARGFQNADLLYEFYTSIASFPGSILDSLGNYTAFKEIHRRRLDHSLRAFTKTFPWLEIGRHVALKANFSKLTRHEEGVFCVDAIYRGLDRHVAQKLKSASRKGVNFIYAYEDGALQSFIQAKALNFTCLYDLPIGYWRAFHRLLKQEQERWPDWASTITGFNDSVEKLAQKDEEIRLSDRIYVASNFTATTLQEFPGNLPPVKVIPYGFPPVVNSREYTTMSNGRSLKILFVGGLSQRKGIADLFAAVDKLGNHVSLTLVGHKATNNCKALDIALAKHRWIPSLPHDGILRLMKEHDVLIFPSLFEGFGLVITEAMSQGTPVITTDRTAGPDLLTHGTNGWLIDAGSTLAIKEAIEEILYNPAVIKQVGHEAMNTARSRPWEVYGKELAESLKNTSVTTMQIP